MVKKDDIEVHYFCLPIYMRAPLYYYLPFAGGYLRRGFVSDNSDISALEGIKWKRHTLFSLMFPLPPPFSTKPQVEKDLPYLCLLVFLTLNSRLSQHMPADEREGSGAKIRRHQKKRVLFLLRFYLLYSLGRGITGA